MVLEYCYGFDVLKVIKGQVKMTCLELSGLSILIVWIVDCCFHSFLCLNLLFFLFLIFLVFILFISYC